MPSLSKKYKINYNKRYTISKNKNQQGHKSIKVYNRVKRLSRKRKDYIGGDIEVPAINNIFPSGQTYQPNPDCLEKECDKDDAGKKTTTCLNTQIVMNLFRQTLDDSEQETMDRIDGNFTDEERNEIFKFISANKKDKLIEYLQDKFLKTTSVLNNLSKPDFAFYHVNVNKHLQTEFIKNLDSLFLIKNFTWNDFVKIYKSLLDK